MIAHAKYKELTLSMKKIISIITFFSILFTIAYAEPDKSGVSPNVISLPSGPGSIEGLGESFSPQLNSGTSTYSIELKLPPGRNNCAPNLDLVYNSGNGNRAFGLGWNINSQYIQLQTDKGQPFYTLWPNKDGVDNNNNGKIDEVDEFDTIIYSNKEELIPTKNGFWRLENESEFIRFERFQKGWLATLKDGTLLRFGISESSRIQDQENRIFKWCIEELVDTNGNKILYTYEKIDSSLQLYCSTIQYNCKNEACITIQFNYEKRPDIIVDFRPGYELKTSFRCTNIRIFERNNHVRTYRLGYEQTTNYQPLSLLTSLTQIGSDEISQLPPARFSYVPFSGQLSSVRINTISPNIRLSDPNIEFIDLNADGLPDILNTNLNPHYYYLNLGATSGDNIKWSPKKRMDSNISRFLSSNTVKLADMDGDGQTELFNLQGRFVRFYGIDSDINWHFKGDIISNGRLLFDSSVRLLDANNDKRIDIMQTTRLNHFVWINQKDNTFSKRFTKNSTPLRLQFDRNTTKIADMNGDRIPDLVHLERSVCFYYPGKGYGDYAKRVRMKNSPDKIVDTSRFILADINGDGLSDVIHAGNNIKVWLNIGLDPVDHSFGRFAPPFSIRTSSLNYSTVFRQADINGNGSIDIVWNKYQNNKSMLAFIDFTSDEQPYQIKTITNGIGLKTTIHYRSSAIDMSRDRDVGHPWPDKLPFAIQVVSKIEINDGMNDYTKTFAYHDGYYDSEEKEFRGFARAEMIETGDISAPDSIMAYKFDTGNKHDALKGKILSTESQTRQKKIFYREEIDWKIKKIAESINGDDRFVVFPFQQKIKRHILEKGNGNPVQIVWEYEYDNFGNRTKEIEFGRMDPGWDDERITEITFSSQYESGRSNWILTKEIEKKITDENGSLVAKEVYFYDDYMMPGFLTKGNLTRVENWIEGSSYLVSERKQYDNDGNIIAIYDPLYGKEPGHFRKIQYDSIYNTYPVREVIYTGNEKVPQLIFSASYHKGFGVVTSATDLNGFTTLYDYDAFSRLISITKPPDKRTTIEYEYALSCKVDNSSNQTINRIETRNRDESSGNGFLCSRDYFDGYGRKVMTRSEGETTGQVIVKDTIQYNSRGLPWKKKYPYFETSSLDFSKPTFCNQYIEHFYDAAGRPIIIKHHAGNDHIVHSRFFYEPLITIIQDEEQTNPESIHFGCKTKFVEDGLLKDNKGRLRQVFEIVKLSDKGEPLDTPVEWLTLYDYNLRDKLIKYIDSQNNQKLIQYDAIGRMIFVNDPDQGQTLYKYDFAGNLIKTIDAKNQTIRYKYDGVNRLIAEYYSIDNEIADVSYHYDLPYGQLKRGYFWKPVLKEKIKQSILYNEKYSSDLDLNNDGIVNVSDMVKALQLNMHYGNVSATNTRGQLSWVKDQSGEEHLSYDSRNRIKWKVKSIIGDGNQLKNFYTGFQYDAMDRITKQIYSDGSETCFLYNQRGLLEAIPGVIDEINYQPSGQRELIQSACGIVTHYKYDDRLRLKQLKTERLHDNLILQNLHYTYDGLTNIKSIIDNRSEKDFTTIINELEIKPQEKYKLNSSQTFQYDSLYRLTQATNPSIYGTIHYRYDRISNMIFKQANLKEPDPSMNLGKITSGSSKGSWNRIGRNKWDPPGPHAITETEKGPYGGIAFTYDNNGNITSKNKLTFQWNFKNRLTAVTNEDTYATYYYDYKGIRKKKQVQNEKTQWNVYYIDEFSEVRQGKLLKYIYVGKNRIACFDNSNVNKKQFYCNDHLGSISFVLSEAGKILNIIAYFPFGKKRFGLKNFEVNYQFTGIELDNESDLHYFNSRYYDSVVGSFFRVDDLGQVIPDDWLKNPQQLNIYAYCRGNPIKYIDPSGNTPWDIIDIAFAAWSWSDFVNKPSFHNLGWALLDTAALAPLIPSTGYLRRGVKLLNSSNVNNASIKLLSTGTKFTPKILKQFPRRGWTKRKVQGLIDKPFHTSPAMNKANNNPATAFFNKDGGYVVRDSVNGEIVQVSNRSDPNWVPDPSIADPYIPPKIRKK